MTGRSTIMVVTANDLLLGDAVWLTTDNGWTRDIAKAEAIREETQAQERLLAALKQSDAVVGPYLAEARQGENGLEPVHYREKFRTRGPSNYPHGKQEVRPGG
ncbi:MAG: DUF2849 domain-containing protein [Robiginitomaculum sp.]|nr:DUF2849 domain-containing protein [Robiginitomaculum sp.]MDQ7077203.1 DUF2849 domain-containing protein [Robiginitomaculum sp.]